MKKKSILFVCTANRYRSPFAEVIFQKQLEEDGIAEAWQVSSAGTWTDDNLPAIPHAVQKAQEVGLNLEGHRSTEITEEIIAKHHLIVVMERGHQEALRAEFSTARKRILLLSEIVDGIAYDIPDPAKYKQDSDGIMNELYTLVKRGYTKICELADSAQFF